MDRNSITGLAIIAVIMMVWLQFMSPDKKQMPPATAVKTEQVEPQVQQTAVVPVSATDTFGLFSAS